MGDVFRRVYSKSAVRNPGNVFRDPDNTPAQVRKLAARVQREAAREQSAGVVTGVVPYGLFRAHLPASSRYVTFLREPVDRTLSYYALMTARGEYDKYSARRSWPHLLPRRSPERSPEDRLVGGVYLLDNLATRMLCGRESPFGDLPADALETAKQNLRESFEFVGITERLDESITLLQSTLGLGLVPYSPQKVGDRPSHEEVPEAERLLIEERNQLDLELYSFAGDLFEQRVAAAGDGFQAALDELRRISMGSDRPRSRERRTGETRLKAAKRADPSARRQTKGKRESRANQRIGTLGVAEPSSSLVVYVRIPGAAGFRELFRRVYSKAALRSPGNVFRDRDKTPAQVRRLAARVQREAAGDQSVGVVTGVVPFGLFRAHMPAGSRYVTFLREPVDRTLSYYALMTEERSPEESGVYLLDNLATRMLCGRESPFGDLPADALESAQQNLRESFEFVGITERLDESIALLQSTLGVDLVPYSTQKVGDPPRHEEVPEAERLLIEERNQLDLELYSFARDLFEQRVAAAGDGFQAALDELRPSSRAGRETELAPRFAAVPKGEAETIEIVDCRAKLRGSERPPGPGSPEPQIRLVHDQCSAEIRLFGYPERDLEELTEVVSPLELRVDAPPIYHFENLVYRPRSDCLYDENGQRILETCRPRGPDLSDVRCTSPQVISVPKDAPRVTHPLIYCGVFMHHWGVFLTEGISRLWACLQSDLPRDAALVGPRVGPGDAANAGPKGINSRSFIPEFLTHAGIALDRVVEFPEVTRLAEVFVPHPSFVMRGQAFSSHFAATERIGERIGGSATQTDQPVYLSRSLLPSRKRRYLGEEALESALRRRGVRVVSPERLSFEEQVRLFNRHRVFIGCVGSAFHSLMFALPDRPLRTIVIESHLNNHAATYFMVDLLKKVEANYVCIEAPDRTRKRAFGTLDVESAESWLKALSVI